MKIEKAKIAKNSWELLLTLYQQKIMIQKEYQEQVFSTFFDVM